MIFPLAIGAGLAYLVWDWKSIMSKFSGTPEMAAVKSNLNLGPVSVDTARLYASNAGFTEPGLTTIVAIAQAESSLDPNATLDNKDAAGNVTSTDRGILQINTKWHPEVSDLDAFNPVTAFQAGYEISKGGTNFTPWVTYNTGAYLKYL